MYRIFSFVRVPGAQRSRAVVLAMEGGRLTAGLDGRGSTDGSQLRCPLATSTGLRSSCTAGTGCSRLGLGRIARRFARKAAGYRNRFSTRGLSAQLRIPEVIKHSGKQSAHTLIRIMEDVVRISRHVTDTSCRRVMFVSSNVINV